MPWNQFETLGYDGVLAETIAMTGHDGKLVNAYYARPMGTGPFPAVVLVHHLPGWDEFYRETARRFAQHGYITLCPNLYHDWGGGTPDDVAAKARGAGGVGLAAIQLAKRAGAKVRANAASTSALTTSAKAGTAHASCAPAEAQGSPCRSRLSSPTAGTIRSGSSSRSRR